MSEARSYLDAWLVREPGMELARVFCPPSQRHLFELWGALLHQLDEAAFELSDANVARTKLAWWGEELASMARGAPRHPLARVLATHERVRAVPAPDWHALAHAAMHAGASEHAPADVDALLAQGTPYARLTTRIESQLFSLLPPGEGGVAAPDEGTTGASIHHLLRRLEHSIANFPWPMNLRARHQAAPESFAELTGPSAAALADLAGELAARSPKGGTLFRRCQSALDAARLRRLAQRRFERQRANDLGTLWNLWRAARRRA